MADAPKGQDAPIDISVNPIDPKAAAAGTFNAIGRGARKNEDGTITVKADIVDTLTGKTLETVTYIAEDLATLTRLVEAGLQARLNATTDEGLHDAVVGKVIAYV